MCFFLLAFLMLKFYLCWQRYFFYSLFLAYVILIFYLCWQRYIMKIDTIKKSTQIMKVDITNCKEQLAIIKSYVKERIRIDNLFDYNERIVIKANVKVLLAIEKLESLL